MYYLCLAYGDEAGWNSLSDGEKQEVLAQDAVIRDRGNVMSAVQTQVTSVRNWNKKLDLREEPFLQQNLPLAGFAVIEAKNRSEVVKLVSNTPCARAQGVVEIREFWNIGNVVTSPRD